MLLNNWTEPWKAQRPVRVVNSGNDTHRLGSLAASTTPTHKNKKRPRTLALKTTKYKNYIRRIVHSL
jgi:hypothetical protein